MSKNTKKKMGPLETPAFPPGRSRIAIGWDVPCPHPRVAPNGPNLTPQNGRFGNPNGKKESHGKCDFDIF